MGLESGLKMHQLMARGELNVGAEGGTFDCDTLAAKAAGGPESHNRTMPDSKRSAPINGNQANPDHGSTS